MKSISPIHEVAVAIVVPFIINMVLAFFFFNQLNSVADEYAQVAHYEELAAKAENGEFKSTQKKLAGLYRSLASSDIQLSDGLKTFATAFMFWVFVIVITTAYQALLFFKLKNKYAQNN